MKTIKIIGALLITMLVATGLKAQSILNVPLSQPGKTYKLDVQLVTGSIVLTSYPGKDIEIKFQPDIGEKDNKAKEQVNGMKLLSAGNKEEMQAEENNNVVTIHGSPVKTSNVLIMVPQNEATFKLSTVNNGVIVAQNISGDMEISNVNGLIKLVNVSGSVVANTVNGPITVTFKSIDPKAAMAFSTLNGNVDVTFPASLKANVKLKSDRGEIYSDFDVISAPHKAVVTHNSSNGMYNLKIEDWVYGKIDGGGPEILMKNMNGSIFIRKAK